MIKPEEHLTEPWDMFRVKLPSRKFLAPIRKLWVINVLTINIFQ
jgi:hypothetical protein